MHRSNLVSAAAARFRSRNLNSSPSTVLALFAMFTLSACGGGGGGGGTGPTPPPPPPTTTFTVGGTVTGLTGAGLVLQGPTGTLAVNANGAFSFPTQAPQGSAYDVRVSTQPSNPVQTCTVANGTGTVTAAVTNIAVTCANGALIGGSVSGLAAGATGLVLTNNGSDHLTINTNGAFAFATLLPSGSAYDIRVLSQPYDPYQTCSVQNGSGVVANAGVTAPAITCMTYVPKFASSLDFNNASYSQYAIDATTGQLRPRGYVKIGDRPVDIGAQQLGGISFILSRGSATLHAFSRDPVTGRVTEAPNSPQLTGALVNPVQNSINGAVTLTVHPRLNFVYVANGTGSPTADSIAAFAFNPDTGALSPIPGTPFAAGVRPVKLAIDPTGRFAYAANQSSNTLTAYSINQTTGALTSLGEIPAGGTAPSFPVVHPSGKFLYVPNLNPGVDGTISAFAIGADGALSPLANSPFTAAPNMTAPISFHPSGRFLYVKTSPMGANGSVIGYRIDETTGALTMIGTPTAVGQTPQTISLEQSGRYILVANRADSVTGSISVLRINSTTGELTTVATPAVASLTPAPYAANLDWSGKFLLVPSADGNLHRVFAFDAATGAVTALANGGQTVARSAPITLIGVPSWNATPAKFSSKFAHVPSNTHITAYSINETSGAYTRQSSAGDNVPLASPALSAVAHPGNDALLGLLSQANNFAVSYSMNKTTGALGSVRDATGAGVTPNALVVDPTGRFAYVADAGASIIRQYTWDATAGTIGSPATTSAAFSPFGLAMHPNGRYLYYISNDRWGVRGIDPSSGEMTSALDSAAGSPNNAAIAIHPSGLYVYIARFGSPGAIDVYRVNFGLLSVGQLVFSTSISVGNEPWSMTIDGTGRYLYVSDHSGQYDLRTFRITASDGSLVAVGTPALQFNAPVIVRADYQGKYVHVVDSIGAQLRSYEINGNTGVLTATGAAPIATGSSPRDIAVTENVE